LPRAALMAAVIRQLLREDNPSIAQIIRDTLTEFGAAKPGTVYFDAALDDLHALFQHPRAYYLVAESDGEVVGGCGIFPTEGLPLGFCELVKLYLIPAARGKGIGKCLILRCLEHAQDAGFSSIYLESMDELRHAVSLYEHLGFQHTGAPLGQSGHFGCSIWMVKSLS
jgi:putative acetyltransferase